MITVNFESSTPFAVMPVKLMLGKMEVGTIYDKTQRQILFTVPDEATTGTLKLTYGNAESDGVTFTVGEPAAAHSGNVTGEERTISIDDKFPDETLKMKVTADWRVDTDGGITVNSHGGYPSLDQHEYYGVNLYNTTILFELEAPSWKKPNQGTFTFTLGNSAIKDIEASYSYVYGGWWGNVTFGQPYYTIDKSLTCYDGPADESGLEFSFTQKDNVITGSYLFPKNREGAFIHLLLNIPYTCTRPDDPNTTTDESCTTTGVCQPQGILLLFRNYNYFNNSHDPCDCK